VIAGSFSRMPGTSRRSSQPQRKGVDRCRGSAKVRLLARTFEKHPSRKNLPEGCIKKPRWIQGRWGQQGLVQHLYAGAGTIKAPFPLPGGAITTPERDPATVLRLAWTPGSINPLRWTRWTCPAKGGQGGRNGKPGWSGIRRVLNVPSGKFGNLSRRAVYFSSRGACLWGFPPRSGFGRSSAPGRMARPSRMASPI